MTTGTKIGWLLFGALAGAFLVFMAARWSPSQELMTAAWCDEAREEARSEACPNTAQAEFMETGECY